MALTQISTAGVKDDAVTAGKIPANAVGSSELADNAVDTAAIADQAVALSKLPHGTGSNDGKFLRANNGADPTFETVNTDLVSDTSPQLGGNLDTNSFEISLDDNHAINFGDGNDLAIFSDGTNGVIKAVNGDQYIQSDTSIRLTSEGNTETMAKFIKDGAVELYHDNVKSLSTDSTGCTIQKDGSGAAAALTIKATNGGQAKLDLMTSLSGTNRAARIDFLSLIHI